MTTMSKNPWLVNSIEDFYILKCPECEFNIEIKEENSFQYHAVENHPMSFAFFGKAEDTENISNYLDISIGQEDDNVENHENSSEIEQNSSEIEHDYNNEEMDYYRSSNDDRWIPDKLGSEYLLFV